LLLQSGGLRVVFFVVAALDGKTPVKTIVVPGRTVNIVVK